MSDPPFKTYADTYFLTKKAHDRRILAAMKGAADATGAFLGPILARLDSLESEVALLRAVKPIGSDKP